MTEQTSAFRQPPEEQENQDRDDAADHDLNDVPVRRGGDAGEEVAQQGPKQREHDQDDDDKDRDLENCPYAEAANSRLLSVANAPARTPNTTPRVGIRVAAMNDESTPRPDTAGAINTGRAARGVGFFRNRGHEAKSHETERQELNHVIPTYACNRFKTSGES
jgi:hypothetical protein